MACTKSWGLSRAIQCEVHLKSLMVPELDHRLLRDMQRRTYRNLQLLRRYAGDSVRAISGGIR